MIQVLRHCYDISNKLGLALDNLLHYMQTAISSSASSGEAVSKQGTSNHSFTAFQVPASGSLGYSIDTPTGMVDGTCQGGDEATISGARISDVAAIGNLSSCYLDDIQSVVHARHT